MELASSSSLLQILEPSNFDWMTKQLLAVIPKGKVNLNKTLLFQHFSRGFMALKSYRYRKPNFVLRS